MEEILKKLKDSEQIKEQIKDREQKRQVEFITLNSLLTRVENLEIKFKQLSFESSQDIEDDEYLLEEIRNTRDDLSRIHDWAEQLNDSLDKLFDFISDADTKLENIIRSKK